MNKQQVKKRLHLETQLFLPFSFSLFLLLFLSLCLSFKDYEKAFDEVRRPLLFSILQERYIPNPLLTAIIKIYENIEIKIKLDVTLTQPIKINTGIQQGCLLTPSLFNIYINQIITGWNEEEMKGIKISKKKKLETCICRWSGYNDRFRRCTASFYTFTGDSYLQIWTKNFNRQSENYGLYQKRFSEK